jgi:hypothetical protein
LVEEVHSIKKVQNAQSAVTVNRDESVSPGPKSQKQRKVLEDMDDEQYKSFRVGIIIIN